MFPMPLPSLLPLRCLILALLLAMQPLHDALAVEERALTFGTEGPLTFDAALTLPGENRNGWGVLLIGGGLANDLDWVIPAEIAAVPGAPGDGRLLAEALARDGFTVLRWSTLAHEDPLRLQFPKEATERGNAELLAQARAAADLLSREGAIEPGRLMLVGHSLGAARALQLAAEDEIVGAVVLLAGARLAPLAESTDGDLDVRDRAMAAMSLYDRDGDGFVSPEELTADSNAPAMQHLDMDADGRISTWESVAYFSAERRSQVDVDAATRPTGAVGNPPWGEVSARKRIFPMLYIGGGLDQAQGHQGIIFSRALNDDRLTVGYLKRLGHTLGEDRDDRIAPISPEVAKQITLWTSSLR